MLAGHCRGQVTWTDRRGATENGQVTWTDRRAATENGQVTWADRRGSTEQGQVTWTDLIARSERARSLAWRRSPWVQRFVGARVSETRVGLRQADLLIVQTHPLQVAERLDCSTQLVSGRAAS